ncbi:MAG: hypothetical protein ACE5J0_02420 [Candidatus Paceibacterales bacterium]
MDDITQFILHPNFAGWLLILKIIFLALSLFFFGFIIFALIKTSWLHRLIIWDLREFLTYRHYGVKRIDKKWREIKERLKLGTESEAKLAVIEADSLLDDILKKLGYTGESLGERLDKLTPDVLVNLEEVRRAHKIRSNVIHDPSYHLDIETAERALKIYEKALVELDAL